MYDKITYKILWHVVPLLGNDRKTIRQRLLQEKARKQQQSNCAFPWSAPVVVHATKNVDIEKGRFLYGPCLNVTSRTISESYLV
jgi:hypothetical protein